MSCLKVDLLPGTILNQNDCPAANVSAFTLTGLTIPQGFVYEGVPLVFSKQMARCLIWWENQHES